MRIYIHSIQYKCCAPGSLYKLVMPEREVAICSADEGQHARNSCPELRFFFLLAPHGLIPSYMYVCMYVCVPRGHTHQRSIYQHWFQWEHYLPGNTHSVNRTLNTILTAQSYLGRQTLHVCIGGSWQLKY